MKTNNHNKMLVLFLALTFGIPWTFWTIMMFTGFSYLLFYSAAACSLSGLFLIYKTQGVNGLKLVFTKIFSKPNLETLIITFLLPITWVLGSVIIYGIVFDRGGFVEVNLLKVTAFFSMHTLWLLTTGPISEEFGWRGFMLPHLMKKKNFLVTNLIIGFVWALWHLPIMFPKWSSDPSSMLAFFLVVMNYSIWFGVLYIISNGNLLYCILFHWLINSLQEFSFINSVFPNMSLRNIYFLSTLTGFAFCISILLYVFNKDIFSYRIETTAEASYRDTH